MAPVTRLCFHKLNVACMSPVNNVILIDFHHSLNENIHTPHGTTTIWKNVQESVLQYYAASFTTKRVDSRPVIQLATNEGTSKLNSNESGDGSDPLETMKNSLSSITCPNTCSVKDRLYSAIEELIADLANRDDQEVHANIMFLVLSKRNDEKGYEFLEEADETTSSKLDLLAVLYKSMRKLRTSNIANINFELMRLFPGDVPNDITDRPQEKLLPNLSISAINLSIANGTFEQVLRDRSMKSFDLSNIDIIFSGNDTSSNIDDKSVRVLFAHQNEHLEDKIWMNNIQLDHVMTVRKHGLDLPLCRCLHPLAINDPRFETSSLHSSLSDRSIILLHDRKDENKAYYYTNAITQYGTNAFLLCFNRTPDDVFEKTKEQALEVVEVKVEGWTNPSRMDKIASQANFIFSKEMITGNTIEDMCDIKELVNINPHRYALPPGDIDLLPECNNVRTTERIDRTSRWWLSMADSVSRVMISSHGVSPLQNYGDAFKVEKNLNGDVLKQIRQELISPGSSTHIMTDGVLDSVFGQLTAAATSGDHGQLFTKHMSSHDVRSLAKKLIVGLNIACIRFTRADGSASELCVQIQQHIKKYQSIVNASRQENVEMKTKDEHDSVDSAWTQINKYQNMTLREKEEAIAPEASMDLKPKSEPLPFAHQLPIGVTVGRGRGRDNPRGRGGGTAINPNFRGKRGGNDKHQYDIESTAPHYPDIRVAKPWLKVKQPVGKHVHLSQKRKEEQLGDPASLLRTYWNAEERRQFGSSTNQNDGMIWVTDKRAHSRKRVRKEFDGRLLDGSSSTNGQVEHIDMVKILPLE